MACTITRHRRTCAWSADSPDEVFLSRLIHACASHAWSMPSTVYCTDNEQHAQHEQHCKPTQRKRSLFDCMALLLGIGWPKQGMGDTMKGSFFALAEAKYAGGDSIKHTVFDNVERATLKVSMGRAAGRQAAVVTAVQHMSVPGANGSSRRDG